MQEYIHYPLYMMRRGSRRLSRRAPELGEETCKGHCVLQCQHCTIPGSGEAVDKAGDEAEARRGSIEARRGSEMKQESTKARRGSRR